MKPKAEALVTASFFVAASIVSVYWILKGLLFLLGA